MFLINKAAKLASEKSFHEGLFSAVQRIIHGGIEVQFGFFHDLTNAFHLVNLLV